MKFLIGEGGASYLDRLSYRGVIGLFYETSWEAILTYITFGLFCILAAIGLGTVLKWLFSGLSKKRKSKKW